MQLAKKQSYDIEIGIVKSNTNYYLEKAALSSKFKLDPAFLKVLSLTPYDPSSVLAPGKLSLLVLALETEAYKSLRSLKIVFPEDFKLDGTFTNSASQSATVFPDDVDQLAAFEEMKFDSISNTLYITNLSLTSKTCRIVLAIYLPPLLGKTSAWAISTFADDKQTQTLESNSIDAFIDIPASTYFERTDVPSPIKINAITDLFDFTLEFFASKAMPSGSFVTVFDIFKKTKLSTLGCSVSVYNPATLTSSPATIVSSATSLKASLVAVTFGENDFVKIQFTGCFQVPDLAQRIYLDVAISDVSSVLIMSQTVTLDFTAKEFSFYACTSLALEESENTVLDVSFTSTDKIVESAKDKLIIVIKESGSTFIDTMFVKFDLTNSTASVNIPCTVSGLASLISCTLVFEDQYTIHVTGFDTIESATLVTISLYSLIVPNGSFIVNLQLISSSATLSTLIDTQMKSSSESTITVLSPSAVVSQLRSLAVPTSVYQATQIGFNMDFNLSFELNVDFTINTAHTLFIILPTYGNGFIQLTYLTQMTVTINGLDFNFRPFVIADWISIPVGYIPARALNLAGPNVIQITKLKWPLGSKNPANLLINVINSVGSVVKRYEYAPLLDSTPHVFETFDLQLSDTSKSAVNVKYTFLVAYPLTLDEGSAVELTFPAPFNILKTLPAIQASLLIDEIAFGQFSATDSQVIISNLPNISQSRLMMIEVSGVRNPSDSFSADFVIKAKVNGGIISESTKTFTVTLTDAENPGIIELNKMDIFSRNQNINTDYRFEIFSNITLSKGGIISVDFPMQYPYFTPTPECGLEGSISLIQSCKVNNKTVSIELESQFSGGNLTLIINNVTNPSEGITGPIGISFIYSQRVLAQLNIPDSASDLITVTDGSTSDTGVQAVPVNKAQIEPSANNLYLKNFFFTPNNEGESAEYYFEVYFTGSITGEQELLIMFPQAYDNLLGDSLRFGPKTVLLGTPSIKVNNRIIYIRDFKETALGLNSPLKISIQGIRNPNGRKGGLEGEINIAIRMIDSSVFQYQLTERIQIETHSAPGWLEIITIEMANTYCRYFNDIRITFQLFTTVQTKTNSASLFLILPEKFVLNESDEYSCTMNQYGVTTYYYTPKCVVYGKKIWITFQNDLNLQGKFILLINSIYNLEDEGHVEQFVLSSVDGYRRSIIERSYFSLDNFQFDFVYSGPLIKVNAESTISVIQGTQSVNIGITTDYPLALDLLLKPLLSFGFALSPSELIIKKTERNWALRMTTFNTVVPGDYSFAWEKLKDLVPGYYSPIKRTNLKVNYVYRNLIEIERVLDIPILGNNLDCKVSLAEAPAESIEVQVRFKEDYPGVSIENMNLNFAPGINEQYFSVFFSNATSFQNSDLSSIQLRYRLNGKSAGIYGLNYLSSTILILAKDTIIPVVNKAVIKILTQHNVTLSFQVSEPCDLYYMMTLSGSDKPTNQLLMNQGPSRVPYSMSQFGKVRFRELLEGELVVKSLESGTFYDFHYMVVDRGQNTGSEIVKMQFMTNPMYQHAALNIFVTKSPLSRIEKYQIISTVAFHLSLPIDHVTENIHRYGLNVTEINDGLLNLLVSPMKDSPEYPSPKEFLKRLESASVTKQIPYFDGVKGLYFRALETFYISFLDTPEVIEENESSLVLSLKLSLPGYVYAVAIPEEKYSGFAPNPVQIVKGLSFNNERHYYSSLEVFQNNTDFNFTMTSLPSNQTFYIFLLPTTGSEAVLKLMDRDYIVEIYASTLEPTIRTALSSISIFNPWIASLIFLIMINLT